jgi:hypothetical protein
MEQPSAELIPGTLDLLLKETESWNRLTTAMVSVLNTSREEV